MATNRFGIHEQQFFVPYRLITLLQNPRRLKYVNETKTLTWDNDIMTKSASVFYHHWITRVTIIQHHRSLFNIDLDFENCKIKLDMLRPYQSYNITVRSKDRLPENQNWSKIKYGYNAIEIHTPIESKFNKLHKVE